MAAHRQGGYQLTNGDTIMGYDGKERRQQREVCQYHNELISDLAEVKAGVKYLVKDRETNNGKWDKHLTESETYRSKIIKQGEQIKTLFTQIEIAAKEKLNSTKASQYRISLVTGSIIGIFGIITNIVLRIWFK